MALCKAVQNMAIGDKISDKDWKILMDKIARSDYRGEIDLGEEDIAYIDSRGFDMIVKHAEDFVERRLGPANPRNEGKQTPLKGHPLFLAQHATGANSRKALAEFHGIPEGVELSRAQIDYVTDVVLRWLTERLQRHRK
jgi:hypothetical protein